MTSDPDVTDFAGGTANSAAVMISQSSIRFIVLS